MVVFEELDRSSYSYKKREELNNNLRILTEKSGYDIIQINGQRVYTPRNHRSIPPPPKGCEVFIGKLTKTIFEDELIPLFERIGPLYKFRLMLDFTEKTRGYAFATYFNPEHANLAIKHLNNYEIRRKVYIGVYKSVDNCRLFVGNIPVEKTHDEVLSILKMYAEGIVDLIMFQDHANPKLNRGFVFVEFESHRCAAVARRQFNPNNLIIWDRNLYVDWADPIPTVDNNVMAKITVLYLSNLPVHYKTEDIMACICTKVSAQIIRKVHKNLSYAFVHFNDRSSAEYAFGKLQNLQILNNKIKVEWSRPRQYSKKYRCDDPPNNFCTSVPPSQRRLVYLERKKRLSISSGTKSSVSEAGQSHINFSY